MGTFTESIDRCKPLADSRGFEIQPQNVNGDVHVLVTRTTKGEGRRHFPFATVAQAALFLKGQPELPRFRVRAYYTLGEPAEFNYHDVDSPSALVRAARDAGRRSKPGYTLKSLEIV